MLGYIPLFIILVWSGLLGFYARDLRRCWREPVLRFPVVIFESDDWGAGPLDQTAALKNLREILSNFKDRLGRSPVVTLGIILATADTKRIRDARGTEYFSASLLEPVYAPLLEEIHAGVLQGIFALHLHGMEHYWPQALMQAAAKDKNIRDWLQSDDIPSTESLPSPLQSRWTDASVLPSRALESEALHSAVSEEARLFVTCFNVRPHVAVATTFVWNEEVEAAWAKEGIDVITTPGARNTCREATGKPGGVDKQMANGELSKYGQVYLVRDVYFEPLLGHLPERLANDARERARLGRPCLVEMHRFNFIGAAEKCEANVRTLKKALEELQYAFPETRFLNSLELADAMRTKLPALIEARLIPRIRIWLRRIEQIRGFAKLSRISGLVVPLYILGRMVGK